MRTFLAIDPGAEANEEIIRIQSRLDAETDAPLRLVRSDQIHLTLVFLGEIEASSVPEIQGAVDSVARQFKRIPLCLHAVGCFPPRGDPRVIWAGVDDPTSLLCRTAAACIAALDSYIEKKERRVFVPHITIARTRTGAKHRHLRDAVAKIHPSRIEFEAGELILYRSTLSQRGAEHAQISRHTLKG